MRVATAKKFHEPRRVIADDRLAHRSPRRQRLPPSRKLRFAGENPEIGNEIERVEVAKHRAEYGIDKGEILSVKPRPGKKPALQPFELRSELAELVRECRCI